MEIRCADHPALALHAFVTRFPVPLGEMATPEQILGLLVGDASAPVSRSETVRARTRDLLRHGGYKPTGRGKPASEYLVGAAEKGILSTINLAVDAANAVSLHSGIPISVLDLGRTAGELTVEIPPAGASYVFNQSGQEIDVGGLLSVHDENGPCGNAVKDAQRTKTSAATTETVSLLWGSRELAAETAAAENWYRELLTSANAATEAGVVLTN